MYKYPSIDGKKKVEEFLRGQRVIVQEKLDGSNVAIVRNGDLTYFQSRNKPIDVDNPDMFRPFITWAQENMERIKALPDAVYYGEQLNTNKLRYAEQHPFVLFDIFRLSGEPAYDLLMADPLADYALKLFAAATWLHCPSAPVVHIGSFDDYTFQEKPSAFDANVVAEGVVYKAFNVPVWWTDKETHERVGKTLPFLYAKEVRAEYKEVKTPQKAHDPLSEIAEMFATEARIDKAIQRVRERGIASDDSSFVGQTIGELNKDILKEEEEAVKDALLKAFWKPLTKRNAERVLTQLNIQ